MEEFVSEPRRDIFFQSLADRCPNLEVLDVRAQWTSEAYARANLDAFKPVKSLKKLTVHHFQFSLLHLEALQSAARRAYEETKEPPEIGLAPDESDTRSAWLEGVGSEEVKELEARERARSLESFNMPVLEELELFITGESTIMHNIPLKVIPFKIQPAWH